MPSHGAAVSTICLANPASRTSCCAPSTQHSVRNLCWVPPPDFNHQHLRATHQQARPKSRRIGIREGAPGELLEDLRQANEDLVQTYEATLEGWVRALDMRDHETEGHARRVTDLTVRLAQAWGSLGDELTSIRRGALLHDIGKIGVPDHILLKAGPLDDEEWKLMRMHPVYARQMLEPIQFLAPALDIPSFHHEKWDGTGYPSGLKGDADSAGGADLRGRGCLGRTAIQAALQRRLAGTGGPPVHPRSVGQALRSWNCSHLSETRLVNRG